MPLTVIDDLGTMGRVKMPLFYSKALTFWDWVSFIKKKYKILRYSSEFKATGGGGGTSEREMFIYTARTKVWGSKVRTYIIPHGHSVSI